MKLELILRQCCPTCGPHVGQCCTVLRYWIEVAIQCFHRLKKKKLLLRHLNETEELQAVEIVLCGVLFQVALVDLWKLIIFATLFDRNILRCNFETCMIDWCVWSEKKADNLRQSLNSMYYLRRFFFDFLVFVNKICGVVSSWITCMCIGQI